jgi:hypothetical protein
MPPVSLRLYTPGQRASGTAEDRQLLQDAAIDCWVFRMRRHGQRLPVARVPEPTQGLVVPIDRYGEPDRFYVRLYRPGQLVDWCDELHSARLRRADKGCYLFAGDEWVDATRMHHLQTWLCTPTLERGVEILQKMEASAGS